MVPWLFVGIGGCWEIEEQLRHRRVWEMQDHESDAVAAREALAHGQLGQARQAGGRLAEPDLVPGLPESALPWLASVRAGGEALSREVDIPSAAARLLAITGDCAGCHRALSIEAPNPLATTGLDVAWMGLVFESEERWDAGVGSLGEVPDLADAVSWPDRRAAFASLLAAVSSGTTLRAEAHTP